MPQLLNLKTTGKSGSDQFRTPEVAITHLLDIIDKKYLIWEPTDLNGNYNIVKVFKENNYDVFYSGSSEYQTPKEGKVFLDKNFFEVDPNTELPKFMEGEREIFIVTNPPYSGRNKEYFLEHGLWYLLGDEDYQTKVKGFAYLLPMTTLEGFRRHQIIFSKLEEYQLDLKVICFDRRVDFIHEVEDGVFNEGSGAWFGTSWFIVTRGGTGKSEILFRSLYGEY